MLCRTKFNFQKFLHDALIVLVCCKCISEKNSDFCLIQYYRLVLCNQGGECLLRSMHCVLI